MKPGYKTTEFWIALASQVLNLLVILHAVSPTDQASLQANVAKAIVAIFTILASAKVIVQYIQSRTDLKQDHLEFTQTPPPDNNTKPPTVLPFAAALIVLALGASAGSAQSVFPWRRLMETNHQNHEQRLQHLESGHGAPAPSPIASPSPSPAPQIIVLGQPLQQIPLGGQPLQQIPLGRPPLQQIPLGGPPIQQIPLGQPPLQQIPLGGPPLQQIDKPPITQPPSPPLQSIPLGPAPLQPPPKTTFTHALWKPSTGRR